MEGADWDTPGISRGQPGSERDWLKPNRRAKGSDGKKLLAFGVAYLTL